MKKDVLLALLIGFTLGSVIAVLAVKLPLNLDSKNNKEISSVKITSSPSITSAKENIIGITSPTDQTIFTEPEFKLEGKLSTGSALIIETPLDSLVLTADNNGMFSGEFKLAEGSNRIYLTAVGNLGITESKTLNLFYTSEKL